VKALRTVHLGLEPSESGTVELLIWRAVCEAVCDLNIREVFEDAALHSQLVEVPVACE
jgi:hypothetical protein